VQEIAKQDANTKSNKQTDPTKQSSKIESNNETDVKKKQQQMQDNKAASDQKSSSKASNDKVSSSNVSTDQVNSKVNQNNKSASPATASAADASLHSLRRDDSKPGTNIGNGRYTIFPTLEMLTQQVIIEEDVELIRDATKRHQEELRNLTRKVSKYQSADIDSSSSIQTSPFADGVHDDNYDDIGHGSDSSHEKSIQSILKKKNRMANTNAQQQALKKKREMNDLRRTVQESAGAVKTITVGRALGNTKIQPYSDSVSHEKRKIDHDDINTHDDSIYTPKFDIKLKIPLKKQL
jgi:hypothetical protein